MPAATTLVNPVERRHGLNMMGKMLREDIVDEGDDDESFELDEAIEEDEDEEAETSSGEHLPFESGPSAAGGGEEVYWGAVQTPRGEILGQPKKGSSQQQPQREHRQLIGMKGGSGVGGSTLSKHSCISVLSSGEASGSGLGKGIAEDGDDADCDAEELSPSAHGR
jgi:hypothetical protein